VHLEKNIGGIANYVVEGLDGVDQERIDAIEAYIIHSIESLTDEGQTGHFALKLSSMLSLEAMTKFLMCN
jgi:hypothetical protein